MSQTTFLQSTKSSMEKRMDTIEAVVADMRAQCEIFDSIGAGHAAMPIWGWVHRLESILKDREEGYVPLPGRIPGSDTLLKSEGKTFRCSCGANVFSKTNEPGYYLCNGCDTGYETK